MGGREGKHCYTDAVQKHVVNCDTKNQPKLVSLGQSVNTNAAAVARVFGHPSTTGTICRNSFHTPVLRH